ncbi:MAG: hypothetical protein IPM29_11595 [Planctomycetes bacterium]|nr:hypothetical protein [Planctomycetota bacterium]
MSILRAVALTAAVASTLSAQSFVTSPRGFEAAEGNSTFTHFSVADRRFQQVDNTQQGQALLVRSLGVRRDGGPNGGGIVAGARRADLEVTMGIANFGVLHAAFDDNYVPGSRQVTYVKKPTSLPSWTGNAGTPAPFDFVMLYDAPYAYAGRSALIIDFTHENLVYGGGSGNAGGSSVDREFASAAFGVGTPLALGCTATGMTGTFVHTTRFENNGPGWRDHGMRMRYSASGAPVNSPVYLNLDFSNANLSIPGLCTTLNALPTISLLAGISSSAGSVQDTSLSFGYDAALAGATFVTQLLALDAGRPGIPVVLSNGRQSNMPADPTGSPQACAFGWCFLPENSGTLFFGGGFVLQLGY